MTKEALTPEMITEFINKLLKEAKEGVAGRVQLHSGLCMRCGGVDPKGKVVEVDVPTLILCNKCFKQAKEEG